MQKLLREPLLHFLLLGVAIFVAYRLVPQDRAAAPGAIVITAGQVENLASTFAKTWQRPPTAEELAGLVNDRLREEVYYREARALGLDQDDTVIRRRLRQKMEFISDDLAAQTKPTEAELDAYLQAHADQFRTEPRFSFRQVYLDPAKHGSNLARDATQLLAQLNKAGPKAETISGDGIMLERDFTAVPAGEITKQFGEDFSAKLAGLPSGQWQGPVMSGYGVHLVLVSERTEARLPPLNEVRDTVQREWANARRVEANEKFYQGLLKNYTVTIEQPGAENRIVAATK